METSSSAAEPRESERTDDDTKPASSKPTLHGLRRSCDRCRRQKKKCDGGRPCGRCLAAAGECTYSMRVWHQSNRQQQQQQQPRDPGGVHSLQVVQHSTSGAVLGHRDLLPFKRCRLSASPATGLVGMQENSFLSDFFGCVGFLPLTTQSHIRETMVKIMLNPASRRQSAFGGCCGEARPTDAAAMRSSLGRTFGGRELPMGPSTCTFWCAVALGALVQGSPIESVARYLQLATGALSESYSGPADVEVAQAWAMLGHLFGFMGDEAKFREYMALSDTFLTTSVEQGSTDTLPLGFAEVVQHRNIGEPFNGNIEPVCSSELVLPQLNGVMSEHELCSYVMQSLDVFEQAVYAKMTSHSAVENDALGGAEPSAEGTGDQPHRTAVPASQAMSDAMVSVWSEDYNTVQFGPLEEAVDRPGIRAGLGGIYINGTLMFYAACKGDVSGTLKRIDRCAEVFVRYPGLCRSVMGAHWLHIMSAVLAALDVAGAQEMYEVLRSVYNSFRLLGSSPLPPLEEWQGLSGMCEDPYCRAFDGVIASDKMKAFSHPVSRSVACEVTGDKGEERLGVAEQDQSMLLTPGIIPGEEPVTPAQCCPGSSAGRSDLSRACGTSWGLSRAGHDGTERRSESTDVPETPTASASRTSAPNRFNSKEEFDEDGASSDADLVHSRNEGLVGRSVAPHETMLVMPHALSEAVEYIEEDDLAAADWLEAVHALSEAATEEPGQAPNS